MELRFVTKPAFTVVGLRIRAKGGDQAMSHVWDKFVPRMGEIKHASDVRESYGVMDGFDAQDGMMDYMAGNPVDKVADLPKGMTSWDVPANTYAVFETTLGKIGETFHDIHSKWLPASGRNIAPGPHLELYGEDFSPANPKVSIYIPVERQS